jgi:hypothetical protein
MHARALKTFHSKYGLIRRGTIFQPEPNYAKALKKNRLIEDATEADARQAIAAGQKIPGPGDEREDKSIPRAPLEKDRPGKGDPGKSAPKPGSSTAATPDAGKAPKSSASPRGRASREKTLTSSSIGGGKSVTTPKRKRAVVQPVNPSKHDAE